VGYKGRLALKFLYGGAGRPSRVGIFPGAWNPPTVAHVEIARAARQYADDLVWVLPRVFPHKEFEGVTFADRCRMLEKLAANSAGSSVAISDGGLYSEIAAEAREFFGPETEILLVCGRDAAERMATWDYGHPGVFDEMLRRFRLLVAARRGQYEPAGHHSDRILKLNMDSDWDEVSSTEVRSRIVAGDDWRQLVPPEIIDMVESLY